jgi:hypothetical protein
VGVAVPNTYNVEVVLQLGNEKRLEVLRYIVMKGDLRAILGSKEVQTRTESLSLLEII